MYSDAKVLHFSRISVVFTSGAIVTTLTFSLQSFRPAVGAVTGFALLILTLASSTREKRKIELAATVQELFDTNVYKLPWPTKVKVEKPSAADIARASLRNSRKNLENWYGIGTSAVRPLDLLICQRANLGWGIATHRAWAAFNLWLGVLLLAATTAAAAFSGLTLFEAILGVYAPLVPTFKELIDSWIKNQQSAKTKEGLDSSAAALWNSSIKSKKTPSESQCRKLQDGILESRMGSPLIPDWFNSVMRNREESVMRLSAADYEEQVVEIKF